MSAVSTATATGFRICLSTAQSNAGLFARIGDGGVVMSVGLENAIITLNSDSGESYAGVLAARVDGGRVSVVWARGAQVDAVGAGAIAGGLVGYLSGASEIVDNWFSGEVEGMVAGGGLIGDGGLEAGGTVRANWAVARVQGRNGGRFRRARGRRRVASQLVERARYRH